jgi:hypothetical protein
MIKIELKIATTEPGAEPSGDLLQRRLCELLNFLCQHADEAENAAGFKGSILFNPERGLTDKPELTVSVMTGDEVTEFTKDAI